MVKVTKEAALEYHSNGRPGKIEVKPTKPYSTQSDLSLAYSPGVAYPCLEIQQNPDDVYKYTDKGNLVAVISNGTAVLGLGNIGAMGGPGTMMRIVDEQSMGTKDYVHINYKGGKYVSERIFKSIVAGQKNYLRRENLTEQ